MQTKLLSIGQVAEVLGVSASSVRLLCDSGRLPSVRPLGPNGHRKVRPEALETYLAGLEGRSELPAQEVLSKRTLNSDEVREGLKRWLLDHFQLYEKLKQRAQSA